ncbi:uncharacterized protein EI97DRAFT_434382 [Westerdykella ornata]|uniref:Uncharacterized protein n=1 Tax=Westerdykella ornata TaxID=318751 RepID=A0A6A6JG00_WESOR|nr:uncharacterized protein EI97DRAFT_434382 [Westerdykella ornata]KAF2275144.1 hypothetical protein EI97DRAFT_434382 [Westerdykella ornata]
MSKVVECLSLVYGVSCWYLVWPVWGSWACCGARDGGGDKPPPAYDFGEDCEARMEKEKMEPKEEKEENEEEGCIHTQS